MNPLELPGMPLKPMVPSSDKALSNDRRRTLRQKEAIERGDHPLGLGAVRVGVTCGECVHRIFTSGNGNWMYPKCEMKGVTHGPATDCRAWWPGCPKFEAKK